MLERQERRRTPAEKWVQKLSGQENMNAQQEAHPSTRTLTLPSCQMIMPSHSSHLVLLFTCSSAGTVCSWNYHIHVMAITKLKSSLYSSFYFMLSSMSMKNVKFAPHQCLSTQQRLTKILNTLSWSPSCTDSTRNILHYDVHYCGSSPQSALTDKLLWQPWSVYSRGITIHCIHPLLFTHPPIRDHCTTYKHG